MNLTDIYNRQFSRVYRIAMLYLKNVCDAEDAVQNVFIKYIESNVRFHNISYEKAWFVKTTKNYCLDVLKSSWKRKIDLGDIPEIIIEDKEEKILFDEIMALPEKYREVIYLYYYEEYPIKDISKILKRKESTIQTQLASARKKLKIILEGEV